MKTTNKEELNGFCRRCCVPRPATALRSGAANARRQGRMGVQREAKPVETGQKASSEPGEEADRRIKTLATEPSARATDKIQTA